MTTESVDVYIYQFDETELHMVGRYVAVRWNTREIKRKIKGDDGTTYTALVTERDHGPYISFVTLRESRKGEYYLDEDSPVDGGISASEAERVVKELTWAVEYIKKGEY